MRKTPSLELHHKYITKTMRLDTTIYQHSFYTFRHISRHPAQSGLLSSAKVCVLRGPF